MAVTTQPRAARKETETFVKELDPQSVIGRKLIVSSVHKEMKMCV